jgi:hypothetical protein
MWHCRSEHPVPLANSLWVCTICTVKQGVAVEGSVDVALPLGVPIAKVVFSSAAATF